jgi:outer membrane protein insertion porin family
MLPGLLLAMGVAAASAEAPWYAGLPVAQVSLEAAEGSSLPSEYLEPLLRVRQGDPLSASDLRQDLALLYRAGRFSAVEAVAEPWTLFDESGEPVDAVRVSYVARTPPSVERVVLRGVSGASRRIARGAVGVDPGDAFFKETAIPEVEARVVRALAAEGWLRAQARASVETDARGRRTLAVEIDPGVPRRYGTIDVVGPRVDPGAACPDDGVCGLRPRQARRWLRAEGVRAAWGPLSGSRFVRAEYERALEGVRQGLVSEGWLQARVTASWFSGVDAGQDRLRIRVETGPRLQIDLDRRGPRGKAPRPGTLPDILGLHGGERMTRGSAAEATRRVQAWYDERGHLDAVVETRLDETADGHRLTIEVEPGRRTRVGRIEVSGTEAFASNYIEAALRQADPEGLGEGLVSRAGLEKARKGLREFYRGHGFLDTKLEFGELRPAVGLSLRGRSVVVPVSVVEGPRTTLKTLEVSGGTGLEAPRLRDARSELQGEPYSPGALEALGREIASAYRAQGYLNADVRVETAIDAAAHEARAIVRIRSGHQIRLRSVVIQGNRRSRRRIIEREVALDVGQPITPDALARTRSGLYGLDLFRVVNTELVGDDDRSRDLLLILDEKPNILLEAGGGVATDQGVRVRGRAAHRNLGGWGHKLTLLGQIGLEWLSDSWRLDTAAPVWRAAATYQAPHVPGRGQELVVEGLLLEAVQEPAYRLERSGGSVLLRVDRGTFEGAVGYRMQVRRLEDVDPGALVPGDPWLPYLDLSPDLSGTLRLPSATRLTSGPRLVLLADRRNDRFNPTRGTVVSGVLEANDGLLSAPLTLRGEGRVEQYIGLGPLVLDVVGRAGAGWAAGDDSTLGVEDRFYLGGSSTLRGFRLNSVGPANLAGRPQVPFSDAVEPLVEGAGVRAESTHWVNTGGDSLLSLQTELRVPMPVLGFSDLDSASVVLFNELGHVSFRDPDVTTTSTLQELDPWLRASFGTGLRVATPIGPAALALGYNPWRIESRDEPAFLAHLSLGEL